MARFWRKWKNRWDPKDPWHYRERERDFSWIRKTIIAGLIFALVYGAHISETRVGGLVDDGVRYILATETDFSYIAEKISSYAPGKIDVSVFKRAPQTVSEPADPLKYMSKPVDGKIAAVFGMRTHPILKQEMMHEGITIEAPLGTSVRAAAPGTVKSITDSAQHGKVLIIENSKDVETIYGHLGEILVAKGENVSQGQIIARVGKTGMTNTPALYFEIREKGKPIDPFNRIKGDFPVKEGK